MKEITAILEDMDNGVYDSKLREVYVDENLIGYHRERYAGALVKFRELFGEKKVEMYSAPGRSEVCGNHTDHQHGHVLAAAVNLDAVAVAAPTDDRVIRLVSDDFPMVAVDLRDLEKIEKETGTTAALIRGVASCMAGNGRQIGGFEAFVTSDVLMGAGMSSSAAFESLVGTIFSGLYNNMAIPPVDIAKAGQFAENIYFGKPCGLMDQMACSVGGLIYIDFLDEQNPLVEQVPCDLERNEYNLCIIDTKGSHADLTDDYAEIPKEMKQVAEFLKKPFLREADETEFYKNIAKMRERISDRAILRAMHFFAEQRRVREGVEALAKNDFEGFLDVISRSGNSSSKLLQNIYSSKDVHTQNVTVALAASEHILWDDRNCHGACRIHGGGFAGTIQAFVKDAVTEEYRSYLESIFGGGACHVLKIRPYGGIKLL